MKKIIKKIFGRKKLTKQETPKKFEHLGIDSRSEEGDQLQISFEKTRTRESNRINPELRKLKKSMEKSYMPPEDKGVLRKD